MACRPVKADALITVLESAEQAREKDGQIGGLANPNYAVNGFAMAARHRLATGPMSSQRAVFGTLSKASPATVSHHTP